MPVSAGSYTVGSGGDYPDWVAAFADLLTLTGDVTFIQISDITISRPAGGNAIGRFGAWNAGFNCRCTSDKLHQGKVSAAWTTFLDWGAGGILFDMQQGNTGGIYFDELYFELVGSAAVAPMSFGDFTGSNTRFRIFNNMFNMGNRDSLSVTVNNHGGGQKQDRMIFNNKIWNKSGGVNYSITWPAKGLIENNSIYNSAGTRAFNFQGNQDTEVRNNVAVVQAGDAAFVWGAGPPANSQSYNNAASDASSLNAFTQSGNITNIVAGDEFASLSYVNDDFLVPLVSGQLGNGGTTPVAALNTAGIDGSIRPALNGRVSIGAHQNTFPPTPVGGSGSGIIIPVWIPGV